MDLRIRLGRKSHSGLPPGCGLLQAQYSPGSLWVALSKLLLSVTPSLETNSNPGAGPFSLDELISQKFSCARTMG